VAASQIRDVCRRAHTFHADEAAGMISQCAYELGWLAEERGDFVEARDSMQRVDAVRNPIAPAYLLALDGKLEAAIRQAHLAADQLQSEWWTKFYAGDGFLFAAICANRLHHRDQAISDLRTALAIYDQLSVIKQAPYHQRRVARGKGLLAHLLAASDRAAAAKLAGEALAWYRATGGYEASAGELEAITRTRP
jgi:hypothetical protein